MSGIKGIFLAVTLMAIATLPSAKAFSFSRLDDCPPSDQGVFIDGNYYILSGPCPAWNPAWNDDYLDISHDLVVMADTRVDFSAVPEPSSIALLSLAALGGYLIRRKKI